MGFLPDDVVLDQESPTPSSVPTPMRGRFLPDDVELDSVVPSLFSDPLGALTSSDWWLTRPSGERISAEQAVVGPASAALDALTAGHGDEITAGGNALIDALIGGSGYDSRLAEIRGIQNETPLAAQLLTGLAAAKLPIGSSIGAKDGLIKTGAKLAAEGAAYGGAYGFGEGEGSAADRITTAADTAKIGAALGPAIGLPIAAASKTVGALARKAPEWADGLRAYAMGGRPSDFAKSAKNRAPIVGSARIANQPTPETDLGKAFKQLNDEGILEGATDAADIFKRHAQKEIEIAEQLKKTLAAVDARKGTIRLLPKYDNANAFIAKAPANERASLRKYLAEWKKAYSKEGGGSVEFAQLQKEQLYAKEYPEGARVVQSLDKAIARDLREFIEKVSSSALPPTQAGVVRGLNKRLSAFEQTKQIMLREMGKAEGGNWFTKLIQSARTSGGFGVPILAGSYVGGLPGAALGAGASYAINRAGTPGGQATIARYLDRAGRLSLPMPDRVPALLAAQTAEQSNE